MHRVELELLTLLRTFGLKLSEFLKQTSLMPESHWEGLRASVR
jgi:hypothetical protein